MPNFSLWVLKSLGSYMRVLRVAVDQFERVIMDEKKHKNKSTNPASPIFMFYVIKIDEINRLITDIDRIDNHKK